MMKLEKVKTSDLKPGPIQDKPLPNGFIERVINYKNKISEVETTSLEVTILNFQRDLYPEIELKIWENIANQYQKDIGTNPKWNLTKKQDRFHLLLRRSTGAMD